jgi:oligopeptide transport system substrate-binding protein
MPSMQSSSRCRGSSRASALALAAALVLTATLTVAEARAAEPAKTLRIAFAIAETSFDPAFASDAASDAVIDNIIESMLDYDYLARPVRLVPRTLESLPTVEDGGRTYFCRVRKGIMFTPDPAFKGAPRELTAADYAYSIKRHLDPVQRSPWAWLVEGKLVGGDEAQAAAKRSGRFDYDAPLPGLEVVDRYTLKIRLKSPDYRFAYVLAVPNMGAVAREVVEAYGRDIGAHPVGTGAYRLAEYKRSSRIVLEANPGFRRATYVPIGPVPAASQPLVAALKDRRLPLVPRIEISVIEEGQARWLAFLKGEVDLLSNVPAEFTDVALDNGRLKPNLAASGIRHYVQTRPNVSFTYFNMEDPVVGGYTPEKVALRRAIGMGYNIEEVIRVLAKGRAVAATGPIPPGIEGFDPKLRTNAQIYDPGAARALLDKFGYRDRNSDGYRELPDGKPLVLERWSTPVSAARQGDELWRKNMDAIGLRMEFRKEKLPEMRKMSRQGMIPMRGDGWNADYPDAENFMQLLFGPNAGQENYARFNLPDFNKLYEEARAMPDSPKRTALFSRMTELVVAYAPWRMGVHDIEDHLTHAAVRHYMPHPIRSQSWMFLELDRGAAVK